MLAAGAGTRLRPLTDRLPKPLAPVAGRPVAAHLLERLAPLSLDGVAVNLHHGAALVERVLGDGPLYVREEWLRGTAGALAGAAEFLRESEDFLVVSSDGLHEIDLAAVAALHRARAAAATVTVKRIERPETCAVVELDNADRVVRFVEKPPPGQVFGDLASIGVYCFSREVLELIPADRPFDIAADLIPLLLDRGFPVAACETTAWWSDIGSPAELLAANLAAARGAIRVRHAPDAAVPREQGLTDRQTGDSGSGERVYAGSRIAPGARIEGPVVIGPDAVVGDGAVIRGALVLPGAEVPPGGRVEDRIHGDGDGVVRSWLGRA